MRPFFLPTPDYSTAPSFPSINIISSRNSIRHGLPSLIRVKRKNVTLSFFEKRSIVRGKCFQGPGSRQRRDWNHKVLISSWRGGEDTPASSVGNKLLSSWPRGNPTDASGAFRSGPWAPTEAVTPFFQNSKLIRKKILCSLCLEICQTYSP